MTRPVRQLISVVAIAAFLLSLPWTTFRHTTLASQSGDERSDNDEDFSASVQVERLTPTDSKAGGRAGIRRELRQPATNRQGLRSGTAASWAALRLGRWHPSLALRQLLPRRVAPCDENGAGPLTIAA